MPESLRFDDTQENPSQATQAAMATWVAQVNARLASGQRVGPNDVPAGYKVVGDHLEADSNWSGLLRDALLTVGGAYGASALGGAVGGGAAGGGGGAGASGAPLWAMGAPSEAELAASSAIPGLSSSTIGTGMLASAPSSTSSLATGGAAANASGAPLWAMGAPSEAELAASSAIPGLSSSTIGTGMLASAPSSTSSLATGGGAGLTDWLKAAKDTGDALSGMSEGRAQGRLGESLANQAQNRTAVDLYNTELNAPRTIARNAVKGDVLANAQDVSIAAPSTIPVPTISGGLRPSMFSDATRQTGRNISQAAANTPIPSPTAPVLPPLPEAGGFDSFLNGASGFMGLASATAPLWRKYLR